jgi:hypothetical protein
VSWKTSSLSTTRQRTYFKHGTAVNYAQLNDVWTRRASVYDVRVDVYRGPIKTTPQSWLIGYGITCVKAT